METHNHSLWQIILESNIINFIVFIGAAIYLMAKSFPSVIKQKNSELQGELISVQERCRSAEEQLSYAEKELQAFKNNLQKMKNESETRINALKEELKTERAQRLETLQQKNKREIEAMKLNLKQEIESKIVNKALQLAEIILQDHSSLKNLNQSIIQNTLNIVQVNPQLLKN